VLGETQTLHTTYSGGVRPPSLLQFEVDCSIRSKVIRGPEIRLRHPGHAHLWVILWSLCREVPSSMSVPNLKRIASLVQKFLEDPKILKLGHVTQATPI